MTRTQVMARLPLLLAQRDWTVKELEDYCRISPTTAYLALRAVATARTIVNRGKGQGSGRGRVRYGMASVARAS